MVSPLPTMGNWPMPPEPRRDGKMQKLCVTSKLPGLPAMSKEEAW